MDRMKIMSLAIIVFLFSGLMTLSAEEKKPIPTPESVDFYGWATLSNKPVQAGDIITAYDPEGNLCGKFVVRIPGLYGYLHTYGDDPTTGIDEGAEAGDTITFKINDRLATVDNPKKSVWTENNDRWEVNLKSE